LDLRMPLFGTPLLRGPEPANCFAQSRIKREKFRIGLHVRAWGCFGGSWVHVTLQPD
jgi:hypothetical protein